MRNDLALRDVVRKHLPKTSSRRTYLAGYGDEALALKFFDYFRDGQRKFYSVRTAADSVELREFVELSDKLSEKFYGLSRENKERLESSFFELSGAFLTKSSSTGQSGAVKVDPQLFWTGFGADIEDQPDEDPFELPEVQSFRHGISLICESTSLAVSYMEDFDVQKRVNWSVCAVTHLAQIAWQIRTKQEAPNTAHADAPGPFGLFLEEILAELFAIYDMPPGSSPSARSALRALENITKSAVEFRN